MDKTDQGQPPAATAQTAPEAEKSKGKGKSIGDRMWFALRIFVIILAAAVFAYSIYVLVSTNSENFTLWPDRFKVQGYENFIPAAEEIFPFYQEPKPEPAPPPPPTYSHEEHIQNTEISQDMNQTHSAWLADMQSHNGGMGRNNFKLDLEPTINFQGLRRPGGPPQSEDALFVTEIGYDDLQKNNDRYI